MNDDDTTDALLRASAYLDGELDPAETALAEADPAVMAEVEQLRGLQDELRQVDAPSATARDAADRRRSHRVRHRAPVVAGRPAQAPAVLRRLAGRRGGGRGSRPGRRRHRPRDRR